MTAGKMGSQYKMACLASHISVQVSGDMYYNGYTFEEFVIQRTAAYIDQVMKHIQARKPSLFNKAR